MSLISSTVYFCRNFCRIWGRWCNGNGAGLWNCRSVCKPPNPALVFHSDSPSLWAGLRSVSPESSMRSFPPLLGAVCGAASCTACTCCTVPAWEGSSHLLMDVAIFQCWYFWFSYVAALLRVVVWHLGCSRPSRQLLNSALGRAVNSPLKNPGWAQASPQRVNGTEALPHKGLFKAGGTSWQGCLCLPTDGQAFYFSKQSCMERWSLDPASILHDRAS